MYSQLKEPEGHMVTWEKRKTKNSEPIYINKHNKKSYFWIIKYIRKMNVQSWSHNDIGYKLVHS